MTTLLSNRMRYQWGRKDPFTFATSSEQWGVDDNQKGMYPVKLYNSSNVLIYQEDIGGDNSGKLPSGGILATTIVASSMSVAIANPITFYGSWSSVISQIGQSSDLYNYYCTSYSRGTDGEAHWNLSPVNKPNVHNDYLDSYIPLRRKSIYDPCPYGYRIPSNGTYNEFTTNSRWIKYSYVGGFIMNFTSSSWILASANKLGAYTHSGSSVNLFTSTIVSVTSGYSFCYIDAFTLRNTWKAMNQAISIRCIEDCSIVSDATEASAGY